MKIDKILTGIALIGIVTLMSGISIAQEIPKLQKNMSYLKARGILIKAGWKPVPNQEQINNRNRSAPVNYFINQRKYTEIVDCAGSGLGLCLFQFKHASGKMLFVTTANNGANKETVHTWRIEKAKQAPTKVNIGCSPRNNTSRILSSTNPNDIHPSWRGESSIGTSWSFIANSVIKNDTATYLKGDLYSPRGGLINKNVFIIKDEWDCQSN